MPCSGRRLRSRPRWDRHVAIHEARELQLAARRRAGLRAAMRPLGDRVFGERPKALAERYRCYWRSWRSEAEHGRPAAA